MSVRPVAFYVWLLVLVLFAALPLGVVRAQTPPTTPPLPTAAPSDDLPPASTNVEVVGQLGGTIGDVVAQGDRAYITVGRRLQILDLSDPAHPSLMGQSPVLSDHVRDITVAGNYAYVTAEEDGLYILDVSNPVEPVVVGSYSGRADSVTVSESHAYIKNLASNQLHILDVSNPANPSQVSSYTPDGRLVGVAVIGGYAYLAVDNGYEGLEPTGTDDLYILDIANPALPVLITYYDSPNRVMDLVADGHHLYLIQEDLWWHNDIDYGFEILDASNPTAPAPVAAYDENYPFSLVVHGNHLYVSSYDLRIYDATNLRAIREIGTFDVPSGVIAFVDNYAYLVDGAKGLRVLDVSNPANLTWAGQYYTEGSPLDVRVVGAHAYVANGEAGLEIVDVSNPVTPTLVSQYDTPGMARSLAVVNDLAYVADGEGGLRVIDVSNPTAPEELGFHPGAGEVQAVYVVDGYAYLADSEKGLLILDVTNPNMPRLVGTHPGAARDVVVVPPYAYVASPAGLRVLNVSNPARPVWTGFYAAPGDVFALAVNGNHAYVAASTAGLRIVDISNPSAPTEVGFHATPIYAIDVDVHGDRAYVKLGDPYGYSRYLPGQLDIVDVANPTLPRLVGGYEEIRYGQRVTVAWPYAYVVNGEYELRILDIANPPTLREVDRYAMPGNVLNFAVTTDYAYIVGVDGLYITDVTSPSNPLLVRHYPLPGLADVVVTKNYAYLISDSLRVLDISDPAHAVQVAFLPQGGTRIALAGNLLYVGEGFFFHIFDISNPLAPAKLASEAVTSIDSDAPINDILAVEGYAYVLTERYLYIYDVANPAAPISIGSYGSPYNKSVAVSGPYLYVAYDDTNFYDGSDGSGLLVLNASQPSRIRLAGRYHRSQSGGGADVAVADGFAYLTTIAGVHVLDVSQPASPALMALYPLQPSGRRIAIVDGHLFVGTGNGSLYVLRYTGGDALRVHLPLLHRR